MLATLADAPLQDAGLVYEPKYDGIRAVIEVDPEGGSARVRIWSRLGNEKTLQFPEVVAAVAKWAAGGRRRRPMVLDGEIVALDERGQPTGFQGLQDRIHLTQERDVARAAQARPVALVVFDLLRDGADDLRGRPLLERRRSLEAAVKGGLSETFRLGEQVVGDGRALLERAQAQGWEGLVVKGARSVYSSGRRSAEWRKLKLVKRQEFVVGGWTEPRRTRSKLGALLLGVWEPGGLRYVGHSGSGFTEKELHRVAALLEPLAVKACPFKTEPPHTNERPHWVRPELVAEVKFSEWTADGLMRHPIFLGLRDDVRPATVSVETAAAPAKRKTRAAAGVQDALAALGGIDPRRGGRLPMPGGGEIEVTNLGKVLWPLPRITKGQLLRYYLEIAPYILPVVDDRPLVMRRFPDGIDRPAFFQHRAPDAPPSGVRVEEVAGGGEDSRRLIGGSLATLMYMAQLAAISQDPWFSRVGSIGDMDHVAIDLDPTEGATFATVREVARRVHDELENLKVVSFPKTSGSRGLHIYVPMRPGTSYEAGLLFGQIVATVVARRFPEIATVERAVQKRTRGTVYIDYLQNIQGKTLACAYSVRASAFAGASTPISWDELEAGLDPRDFTILTLPARLRQVGDLWAGLRKAKGVDLRVVLERAQGKHGKAKGRNKEEKP